MARIYFTNFGLKLARAKIFNSLQSKKQLNIFDVIELSSGDYLPKAKMKDGKNIVYGGGGPTNATHKEFNIEERTLGIGRVGARCGCCFIIEPKSWVTDNALFVSNLKHDYDYSFLMHYLNHLDLNKFANQSAQPVISQRGISKCTIPDLHIKEQKQIALILDAIENGNEFVDIYDLKSVLNIEKKLSILQEELSFQQTYLQQLRQAILQEAVQGKLTKQNKDDEPASALLKRIKGEKQKLILAGKLKKEKELPPITENEIPFELPKGWVWCRLGEITLNVDYGTSEKAFSHGEVPVLRMGNIQNSELVFSNLKYVRRSIKDLPRLFLKNKDLIFNRTNSFELVGKCGVYYGNDGEYTLASYLIRVTLHNDFISPEFTNYYINSKVCRETQIEPQITQQTGQANFSGSKLKHILFALPPLSEQQRIVDKVQQLMQTANQLEQQVTQSQTQAQQLLQAVLKEAFTSKGKVYEMNEEVMMAAEE